jgi:hypothetical protein
MNDQDMTQAPTHGARRSPVRTSAAERCVTSSRIAPPTRAAPDNRVTNTFTLRLALALLILGGSLPLFAADTWPHKPFHFIVPAAAGASSDIAARAIADQLHP